MPRVNTLISDEFVAGSDAGFLLASDDSPEIRMMAGSAGNSQNVPRIVAGMLVLAVGTIILIHLAGLRAMVTVGG